MVCDYALEMLEEHNETSLPLQAIELICAELEILILQSRSMKARFPTIPTLSDLQQLGPEAASLDVLLVDTTKDKTIVALQELAQVLVKGLGANVPLMIKKIADLVITSSSTMQTSNCICKVSRAFISGGSS